MRKPSNGNGRTLSPLPGRGRPGTANPLPEATTNTPRMSSTSSARPSGHCRLCVGRRTSRARSGSSPPGTQTRGPPCATTAPARTSTATRTTSREPRPSRRPRRRRLPRGAQCRVVAAPVAGNSLCPWNRTCCSTSVGSMPGKQPRWRFYGQGRMLAVSIVQSQGPRKRRTRPNYASGWRGQELSQSLATRAPNLSLVSSPVQRWVQTASRCRGWRMSVCWRLPQNCGGAVMAHTRWPSCCNGCRRPE